MPFGVGEHCSLHGTTSPTQKAPTSPPHTSVTTPTTVRTTIRTPKREKRLPRRSSMSTPTPSAWGSRTATCSLIRGGTSRVRAGVRTPGRRAQIRFLTGLRRSTRLLLGTSPPTIGCGRPMLFTPSKMEASMTGTSRGPKRCRLNSGFGTTLLPTPQNGGSTYTSRIGSLPSLSAPTRLGKAQRLPAIGFYRWAPGLLSPTG
mmetsp:Transcript_10286/g.26352  ORF Transcript_10286/g.26352 Transcript_10286/m.26352 type:complete len:202 (-) Transcript_10286:925-1530(-)